MAKRKSERDTHGTGTRQAILAAATEEFAARGFAATGVDRIARHAAVNKAMIYYHFGSKAALYQAVLSALFVAVGERASAIVASDRTPEVKIEQFIEALITEVKTHPHFPPLMMREIAGGATRLDAAVLRAMSRLFLSVRAIIEEGIRAGRFAKVNSAFTYFTIAGPIVLYIGGAPVREAMEGIIGRQVTGTSEDFMRYLQWSARRTLSTGTTPADPEGTGAPVATRSRKRRGRT